LSNLFSVKHSAVRRSTRKSRFLGRNSSTGRRRSVFTLLSLQNCSV